MLFEAYQTTSIDTPGWWWTSQLMFFVLAQIVFYFEHGALRPAAAAFDPVDNTRTVASSLQSRVLMLPFVALAFMVALSVGLPLFACHLLLQAGSGALSGWRSEGDARHKQYSERAALNASVPTVAASVDRTGGSKGLPILFLPAYVWLPLLLAAFSVIAMPFLCGTVYNRNLMFGHLILLVPFCARYILPSQSRTASGVPLFAVYLLLAGAAFTQHVSNTLTLWQHFQRVSPGVDPTSVPDTLITQVCQFLSYAWSVGPLSHHAQASVSFDVIFVTLQTTLLHHWSVGPVAAMACLLCAPLVSVSCTFPLVLAWVHLRSLAPRVKAA